MGNQKLKWTAEEEKALRSGVQKHGIGKWKIILTDPAFSSLLAHRSNIDLKDKWRNLSAIPGVQGGRDKSRVPKVNGPITENSTALIPAQEDTMHDPPRCPSEGKLATCGKGMTAHMEGENGHNGGTDEQDSVVIESFCVNCLIGFQQNLILEALSSIKDGKGSDVDAIITFIEQKTEVPSNFRKLVSSKLKRLVSQGKILKIQNCYKIKDAASDTPQKIDVLPECSDRTKASYNSGSNFHAETLENAAMNAAYKVAEAENKSFVAAESVKEAERISKMAEETESLLLLVTEIYEQCSRGKVLRLA